MFKCKFRADLLWRVVVPRGLGTIFSKEAGSRVCLMRVNYVHAEYFLLASRFIQELLIIMLLLIITIFLDFRKVKWRLHLIIIMDTVTSMYACFIRTTGRTSALSSVAYLLNGIGNIKNKLGALRDETLLLSFISGNQPIFCVVPLMSWDIHFFVEMVH